MDITAVLAVYNKVDLTREFLYLFRQDHPDIPLVIGALGADIETVEFLKAYELKDKHVQIAYGSRDERICFSENFDAAINLVQTKYLVLIHNDILFSKSFFKELQVNLEKVGDNFILYNTLEPLHCQGFVRPGKYLYSCGETLTEVYNSSFEDYIKNLKQTTKDIHFQPGYGFFLAGQLTSFQKVGGFDFLRFRPCFAEDDDFNVRIKLAGLMVYQVSDCFVYHLSGKTSAQSKKKEIEQKAVKEFVRKWGFEPSFWWQTGVERMPRLNLYRRQVGYIVNSEGSLQDLPTIEPFVTKIFVTDADYRGKVLSFLTNEPSYYPIKDKLVAEEDNGGINSMDVLVYSCQGSKDYKKVHQLLNTLVFMEDTKKTGKLHAGGFEVNIQHSQSLYKIPSDENYLLEQTKLKYE